MSTLGRHKFPKEDLVQKFYQGLTMASSTIIEASALDDVAVDVRWLLSPSRMRPASLLQHRLSEERN
jgi:hypothetical protein